MHYQGYQVGPGRLKITPGVVNTSVLQGWAQLWTEWALVASGGPCPHGGLSTTGALESQVAGG